MKYLNTFAEKLAAQSIFFHMSIGALVAFLLIHLKVISSQSDLKLLIGITSIPFLMFGYLNMKACYVFYGQKKYKEIMPYVGRTLGIPNNDSHFHEQMLLDISSIRKKAGYLYVISKFITCFYIGGLCVVGAFSIIYLK